MPAGRAAETLLEGTIQARERGERVDAVALPHRTGPEEATLRRPLGSLAFVPRLVPAALDWDPRKPREPRSRGAQTNGPGWSW